MYRLRIFALCLTLALYGVPGVLHAQVSSELSITPVVIDEKAKPRDILKKVILIKNISNRKLELYPSVNNVNVAKGTQGFTTASNSDALSNSLANWIELSRGVIEIDPGEQKTISFIVRLNFNAIPDTYHALITLTEGGTRAEADKQPPLATITVNVEVQADIKELLQLKKFTTDTFFLSGDDVLFNYELQNIGNQELEPKGEIHIFDRKGAEVASLDVNKDRKTVSPDQESQLASIWTAVEGFGRYKALLTVDYGSSQVASVGDTVYFWIVPWKQLLALSIISLLLMIALALYFHRWLEQRHFAKLAMAGLLKAEALVVGTPNEVMHPTGHSVVHAPTPTMHKEKISHEHTVTHKHPHIPARPSLKDALQKSSDRSARVGAHGGSIDLKKMRATQSEPAHAPVLIPRDNQSKPRASVEGSVINLKKRL